MDWRPWARRGLQGLAVGLRKTAGAIEAALVDVEEPPRRVHRPRRRTRPEPAPGAAGSEVPALVDQLVQHHGSRAAAAAALGCAPGTLYVWRTGRREPSPANVRVLRQAVGALEEEEEAEDVSAG